MYFFHKINIISSHFLRNESLGYVDLLLFIVHEITPTFKYDNINWIQIFSLRWVPVVQHILHYENL